MTPSDQAARYLAKCPPAVSGQGGHTTAYSVVVAIAHGFALDEHEAYRLLSQWNATCQPPWSERELRHKIQDALNKPHDKPKGWKLSTRSPSRASPTRTSPPTSPTTYAPNATGMHPSEFKPVKYDIKEEDLPEPIPDGTRELIRALFLDGEGIRIAPARLNDEGKEIPDGGGTCLSREEWLRRLDKHDGNPNGIFSSSDRTGIYVAINPYKVGATKDADVVAFRHALVEFDEGLSVEAQLNLYRQMNLPCAAVIYSGGKSVHAWVKVDARDQQEYNERVRILYGHFLACGLKLDEQNKNQGRLSRLPNCRRFDSRQELLYLNIGAPTFAAWQEEINAEDLGDRHTIDDLEAIDMSDKTDVLLGDDWVNKGGSCLISGPSGIGKSSLAFQCAILWAMGMPAFGITPPRALRSVIIGAENDPRDIHAMVFGVLKRLEVGPFDNRYELVRRNLIIRYNYTASSDRFINVARRIADKDKPDLVWLDPTAAFVGDDLSKQTVIAQFFRNGLHPIAKARGFAWMVINHFTKPPSDSKARSGWTNSDHQYRGAGSYDLTGWARAGITLSEVSDGTFQVRLAKRGKRAGATHPNGEPTTVIWLRHAKDGLFWEQLEAPERQPGDSAEKNEEPTIVQVIENLARNGDMAPFFAALPKDGESKNKAAKRLKEWFVGPKSPASKERRKKGIGDTKAKECIEALQVEGYLTLNDGLYSHSYSQPERQGGQSGQ